jgi:serine/threonine-protein kinase
VSEARVLDGRFRLLDEIGRGGMATVYRAEDLESGGRIVAVKVPLPMFSSGVGSWSMFEREAEILARLDHPGVARLLASARRPRQSYLVTEYVPGCTLAQVLGRRRPLREREAVEIGRRLCEAVEHVHARGIVHYDIKPANVLISADGTIKLIDFGLAHEAVPSRFWSARPAAIASADYAAPEQIRRQRGRRSVDIYALGAVLYELLTGRPPFPGDDPFVVASARLLGDPAAPRRLNPGLSPQLEEIILRALRRDPDERYRQVAQLRRDLERPEAVTMSGLAERLQPVTPGRRARRWARHLGLVAVMPVAVQVLLFLLLWRHFAGQRPVAP